jgi:hypothetical protein
MEYLGKRSVACFLQKLITVVWWMGIVAIILFSLFSLFILFFGLPKGMKPPHFSLDTNFIQVEFTNATIKHPKLLLLAFFPFGAAMIGLGMSVLYQLRKIFATLVTGNPFVLENAQRIRKIGLLIFGGVFVELIAGSVIGKLIMDNVMVKGVAFNVKGSLNIGGIFIGLVILVLAEIFRQGAILKNEQELTI